MHPPVLIRKLVEAARVAILQQTQAEASQIHANFSQLMAAQETRLMTLSVNRSDLSAEARAALDLMIQKGTACISERSRR
jgi:hypothetical protein